MTAVDEIRISQVYEVSCEAHGTIGNSASDDVAQRMRRQHFEWRHQPDPTDRVCGWRYPRAQMHGDRICSLPAAHDGPHDDGTGDGAWFEIGSLPRREDES